VSRKHPPKLTSLDHSHSCDNFLQVFSWLALSEIRICLELLNAMRSKWTAACHCHAALNLLLEDLCSKSDQGLSGLSSQKRQYSHTSNPTSHGHGVSMAQMGTPKRQRTSAVSSNREATAPSHNGASFHNFEQSGMATSSAYDSDNGLQNYNDAGQAPWTQDQMYNHPQPCPNCPMDMFGHLSWESLIQDDGSLYGFWPNNFPEI